MPRTTPFLAILLLTLASVVPLSAQSARPAPAHVSAWNGYDVNITWDGVIFDATEARDLQTLGARMIRLEFFSNPDGSMNLPQFDQEVAAAQQYHIGVLGIVDYDTFENTHGSDWNAPLQHGVNPFITEFAQRARQLATRYAGGVRAWEVWNEENIDPWGPAWGIVPDNFGALMVQTATIIHTSVPTDTVVFGGMANSITRSLSWRNYLRSVYQSPAIRLYMRAHHTSPWDALGLHPYGLAPGSPRHSPLIQALAGMHWLEHVLGDRLKPLWITEDGMPTQPDNAQTEAQQAAFLTQTFERIRTLPYAPQYFWFNYRDITNNLYFGLRRPDDSAKASYGAFQKLAAASS